MDRMGQFIDTFNENFMPKIDYERLQADYKSEEKSYAKGVLNALHTAAVEAYGTSYLEDGGDLDYVMLPGIIQSKITENLCIALLEIDLMSSGEHCGTYFLTKFGCVNQCDEEMSDELRRYLRDMYGSYDYAYTFEIENDIHIEPQRFPPEIREVLDTFREHSFEPVENKYVIGNVNEPEEDMER